MRYRVETSEHNGGTRSLSSLPCSTLASATRVFMSQCKVHALDATICILLVRPRDAHSGTVLASKSANARRAEFDQAYWQALQGEG